VYEFDFEKLYGIKNLTGRELRKDITLMTMPWNDINNLNAYITNRLGFDHTNP